METETFEITFSEDILVVFPDTFKLSMKGDTIKFHVYIHEPDTYDAMFPIFE